MTLPQLFGRVRRHGYAVVFADGTPKLRAVNGQTELPAKLLEELKGRRQEIIEWFNQPPEDDPHPSDPTPIKARTEWETCKECRAVVAPEMTAEDATTVCNQLGSRAVTFRSGRQGQPATDPCPYHPPKSFADGGP